MTRADLPAFHGIIGQSAAIQALFRDIQDFAPSNLPVLIRGESGTGKELVATAVQRLSGRRERGFGMVNCADFTPDLLRSELFGHERRIGRINAQRCWSSGGATRCGLPGEPGGGPAAAASRERR